MHNSMHQQRLTGLALLNVHRDIEIDIEQVLHDFDPLNDRSILLSLE